MRYALSLTATAFVAHYVWERLHCPLFVHPPGDTPMSLAMIQATLGDVGLTWMAQLTMAAVTGRWMWPRGAGRRTWGALLALSVGMALAIEWYALATGRWSYTPANPLIPGLGVSLLPVAQLAILFPLSFVAARFAATRG
jgi:hypothetical protein